MIFDSNYSRTERTGELFEKEIFSRVQDGGGNQPRWLTELFIKPKSEPENFSPKYDNWRRQAKVPILFLNATTLNTGHVWQYTPSWMGEPPGSITTAIDGNEWLRRMYYSEAPSLHRRVRLGHAVAASACVPGLFEPLVLAQLYPNRVVRLVDGGVHDNQGTATLLEQNCTVQLVSDGSGQMNTQNDPSSGTLGVPLRSNDILQARVREAQYCELKARRNASLLRGLMFVHLKKDLVVEPVDWINCEDPDDPSKPVNRGQLTGYGILKEIQGLLAAIRTDLDSFSEVEAYALMTSGYRMTEYEFGQSIRDFPLANGECPKWEFLSIERPMKQKTGSEAAYAELAEILKAGANNAFKIWQLSPFLWITCRVLGFSIAIALFVSLSWWTITHWNSDLGKVGSLFKVSMVAAPVFAAIASIAFGKATVNAVRFRETLKRIILCIVLAAIGWLIVLIHLKIFDKWFLNRGSLKRLFR
jgi:hypothetical protein